MKYDTFAFLRRHLAATEAADERRRAEARKRLARLLRAPGTNGRNNWRLVTYQGIEKTLGEWCDELGRSRSIVYKRLLHGWSVEDALSRSVRPRSPNGTNLRRVGERPAAQPPQ